MDKFQKFIYSDLTAVAHKVYSSPGIRNENLSVKKRAALKDLQDDRSILIKIQTRGV